MIGVIAVLFFSKFTNRNRFRLLGIAAQKYSFIVTPKSGCPLFVSRTPANARNTGSIVAMTLRVFQVLGMGNRSKVFNSVVACVPVDVINLNRPFVVMHGPDNPMRHVSLAKDKAAQVALGLGFESPLPGKPSGLPSQFTCRRTVREILSQLIKETLSGFHVHGPCEYAFTRRPKC